MASKNTRSQPGQPSRTLWILSGILMLMAVVAMILSGRSRLQTNLISVEGSPITLETDQIIYPAEAGGVVPVKVSVQDVSETSPLLVLKMVLDNVPAGASLIESDIVTGEGVSIGTKRVEPMGDKLIVLLSEMRITQPGELFTMTFRVGTGGLPEGTHVVSIFSDETNAASILRSQIATIDEAGTYVSRTLSDGPLFRLSRADSGEPSESPTAELLETPAPSPTPELSGFRLHPLVPDAYQGRPFHIRVCAIDDQGATLSSYAGTILLSVEGDENAILPYAHGFRMLPEHQGCFLFSDLFFSRPGALVVTATDIDNPAVFGQVSVSVNQSSLCPTLPVCRLRDVDCSTRSQPATVLQYDDDGCVSGCDYEVCGDTTSTPTPDACPEDALLCPDGTALSRTGPDCTFPACPTPTPFICQELDFSCSNDGECCSGRCEGGDEGRCIPSPTPTPTPSCMAVDFSCEEDDACCSGICGDDGRCVLPSSPPPPPTCIALDFTCGGDGECCSGRCERVDPGNDTGPITRACVPRPTPTPSPSPTPPPPPGCFYEPVPCDSGSCPVRFVCPPSSPSYPPTSSFFTIQAPHHASINDTLDVTVCVNGLDAQQPGAYRGTILFFVQGDPNAMLPFQNEGYTFNELDNGCHTFVRSTRFTREGMMILAVGDIDHPDRASSVRIGIESPSPQCKVLSESCEYDHECCSGHCGMTFRTGSGGTLHLNGLGVQLVPDGTKCKLPNPSFPPATRFPDPIPSPSASPSSWTCTQPRGDLNCDGVVNIADLSILADYISLRVRSL